MLFHLPQLDCKICVGKFDHPESQRLSVYFNKFLHKAPVLIINKLFLFHKDYLFKDKWLLPLKESFRQRGVECETLLELVLQVLVCILWNDVMKMASGIGYWYLSLAHFDKSKQDHFLVGF